MAEVNIFNNRKNISANTRDVIFTATKATIITAFSASNSTGASVSYKAYITAIVAEAVDPVQPQSIVVKDKADAGVYLIGQKIPEGGTLEVESSTAASLNFYATGEQ